MGVFDGTIGAFVVGAVLSCFLTGICSTQVMQYYQNFPDDRKIYKALVFGCLLLDLAHTAMTCWTIWDYCVANFGNIAHLHLAPWSYGANQILLGLIAFFCRGFYAYRVWIVGKRKVVIPIAIIVLSFASLGFALGAAITVFKVKLIERFVEYAWGISTWLAIACVSDTIITASLVYYLRQSKTGLLHTNSILNRLIELIISTNGLTAFVGIVTAILFWSLDTQWHVAANLALAKLYFNSLLVSLNARIDLKRKLVQSTGHHSESHGLTELGTRKTLPQHRSTQGGEGDVRTALGFGLEDCNPDLLYATRRNGTTSIGDGIKVTTHQTVATDGGMQSSTYLPSEKELSYYSNEKDEEFSEGKESPARSTHFAPDLERIQTRV